MGVPQLADLVLETANAPGTGIITLGGAPEGRQTFADAFPDGGEVYYYASDGSQTEWGVGTLTVGSPNTLVRTKVMGNLFGTDNALNFTSGITVWCEVPAQCAPSLDDEGLLPVSSSPDYERDVALGAKSAEKRYVAQGAKGPQTITGDIIAQGGMTKDGPIGAEALFAASAGGKVRWTFGRDSTPEAGSNAGSSFVISRYADDGTIIDTLLTIHRDTGIAEIKDLSASGSAKVPDIIKFDGEDALNARTAEGRYVRSVPATDGTNIRIVDVQNDAGGNLIATRADGTTQSYAPGSAGVIPATATLGAVYWTRTGNILTQSFQIVAAYDQLYQAFPFAYAADTVPVITNASSMTVDNWSADLMVASPGQPTHSGITNTGILLRLPCWFGGGSYGAVAQSKPITLNLTIMGEV
ncbi:hypothetical protein [Acetobacter sp. LMG 32666]|uniref:hypothetical protein n=1 Tax=Acetobacter sp. LMG 32666 TaxID=2959295 RepID=UPI0030C7E197